MLLGNSLQFLSLSLAHYFTQKALIYRRIFHFNLPVYLLIEAFLVILRKDPPRSLCEVQLFQVETTQFNVNFNFTTHFVNFYAADLDGEGAKFSAAIRKS